jgi:hypothetical protein
LTAVRIKQSDPDLPWKFSKAFSGTNAPNRGSNVQDGSFASYSDGGYGAEVETRKRQKKTHVGTFMQQMSGNDRTFQSIMAPQPQVGFQTQAQAILHRQGDKFQSLPGGYGPNPGQLLRGGQVPRVVFNEGNDPSLRGVNGGGQSSVVLPTYAEAPLPSVVVQSEPVRPARPGLRINTTGLRMGLGNGISGQIAEMRPFDRQFPSPNSVVSGYDSEAYGPPSSRRISIDSPMSAPARMGTGGLLTTPKRPDLLSPSSAGSSSRESSPRTPRGFLYPIINGA